MSAKKLEYRAIEIYRTEGHSGSALVLLDENERSGTLLCGLAPVGDPIETVSINVDRLIESLTQNTQSKCLWCGLRMETVDEAASHVLVCDKGPWVALAKRAAELEALLHEIAEEWAGSECGEPMTAQEAYAISVAKRMYAIAVRALVPNTTRETR